MNTNVEISCLNRDNFEIIKFLKILAAKSNSLGLKSLKAKFSSPPPLNMREKVIFSNIDQYWKAVIFDAEYIYYPDSYSHQTLIF